MSTILDYFKRIPEKKLKNDVYARSLKRKLSALNAEKSNGEKSKKAYSGQITSPLALNAVLDERDCVLVSTDEKLLDTISVSSKDFDSFLCSEKNLQREIHEKVSSN